MDRYTRTLSLLVLTTFPAAAVEYSLLDVQNVPLWGDPSSAVDNSCPAATPLACSGTDLCCGSGFAYLCGGKCWSAPPTAAECASATVTCSGSGGGGGTGCVSGSYCYQWNCNGDQQCLSTNPNGTASGANDEGNDASCAGLLTFGQNFWNIPPATQSCTLTP